MERKTECELREMSQDEYARYRVAVRGFAAGELGLAKVSGAPVTDVIVDEAAGMKGLGLLPHEWKGESAMLELICTYCGLVFMENKAACEASQWLGQCPRCSQRRVTPKVNEEQQSLGTQHERETEGMAG